MMEAEHPIVKDGNIRGWLGKKGEKGFVRAWRRRFFWSEGSLLHYGEQQGVSIGNIDLASALSVDKVPESSNTPKGRFCIITPGRTFALAAASEAGCDIWVETVRKLVQQARPTSMGSLSSVETELPGEEGKSSPTPSGSNGNSSGNVLIELKTAIEERDAQLDELRLQLNDMESRWTTDVAQLQDKLSQKMKQTDLIALMGDAGTSVDDKTPVLMNAIKERDIEIQTLSQSKDLQMKRIQALELQLEKLTKTPSKIDSVTKLAKEDKMSPAGGGMGSPSIGRHNRHRRNSSVGSNPTTPMPFPLKKGEQAQASPIVKAKLETPKTAGEKEGGGNRGSTTLQDHRRKQNRRANSMLVLDGSGNTVGTPSTPSTGEKKLVTPPPWQLKKMMDNVGKRSSLPMSPLSQSMDGSGGSSTPTGTGGPNVMLGLKSHSQVAALPLSGNSPKTSVPMKSESEDGGEKGGPFSKSEQNIAKSLHELGLPTQGLLRLPKGKKASEDGDASSAASSEDTLSSASSSASSLAPGSLPGRTDAAAAAAAAPTTTTTITESVTTGSEKEEIKIVMEAPSSSSSSSSASESPAPSILMKGKKLSGGESTAAFPDASSKAHLGGGADSFSQQPVRRVMSRSADDWAQAAAKARAQVEAGKHEPSVPAEVVLPDNLIMPEKDLHITPSFEGLAEKIEELVGPKGGASGAVGGSAAASSSSSAASSSSSSSSASSGGGSAKSSIPSTKKGSFSRASSSPMPSGHSSRFQEELMDQLRAEQFELLNTLKDMRDEAEITELRMGQLMDRIRNCEEIIDDKTGECEQQKIIIRELRRETGLHRARVEALEKDNKQLIQNQSQPVGQHVDSLPNSAKRLYFGESSSALGDEDESPSVSVSSSLATTPTGSKKSSPERDRSPSKQFMLSDDENGSEDDLLASPIQRGAASRRPSGESARVIEKLEQDIKTELVYRQALEKQLKMQQQRNNVENSNLRSKFAAEMEVLIGDNQRESLHRLAQVEALRARISELESQISKQSKENTRLKKMSGEHKLLDTMSTSTSNGEIANNEILLMQQELEDKETELTIYKKKLHAEEERRVMADANVEALKTALSQSDRETKALRTQLSRQKSTGASSFSPTKVVSAVPPPPPPVLSSSSSSVSDQHLAFLDHSAELKREMEAMRREHQAALSLRDAIVKQVEADLAEERQQRRDLRARMANHKALSAVQEDIETELNDCKRDLFQTLGVNAKLMHMNRTGSPCNVDVASIWEMAEKEGVHWKKYRSFIQNQIDLLFDVDIKLKKISYSLPVLFAKVEDGAAGDSKNESNEDSLLMEEEEKLSVSAFTSPTEIRNNSRKNSIK